MAALWPLWKYMYDTQTSPGQQISSFTAAFGCGPCEVRRLSRGQRVKVYLGRCSGVCLRECCSFVMRWHAVLWRRRVWMRNSWVVFKPLKIINYSFFLWHASSAHWPEFRLDHRFLPLPVKCESWCLYVIVTKHFIRNTIPHYIYSFGRRFYSKRLTTETKASVQRESLQSAAKSVQ